MEDINESKSIESPHEVTPNTTQKADNTKQSIESKVEIIRSKVLKDTADVLNVIMYISIGVAVIAGLVYLSNMGDASNTYYPRSAARAAARCALAASCFSAGVGGGFSCYVIKKLFIGLSVIAEAAEKYLNQK